MITIRLSVDKKNLSSLIARGEEQGIRPVAKKLRLSAKWAKNTIPCGEECPPMAGMEKGEKQSLPAQLAELVIPFCS